MSQKKPGAVIQTSNMSFEILDLFIAYMRAQCQATIRGIGSRGEAGQAAVVIYIAVPILREELAHWQEKEVGDRDLNIEWEFRHGERLQSSAAEKRNFSDKVEGLAVDYANSWTNSVATSLSLYKTIASNRLVASAVNRLGISLER